MAEKEICPKCRRPYGNGRQKTMHHVFPRRLRLEVNTLTIEICRSCHDEIEWLYAEQERKVLAACSEMYWAICNGFLPREKWRTE